MALIRANGYSSEADSAYAQIKLHIRLGYYAPGDRLVETELAERFGMSRTPVREALRSLQHDGWVVRGPRGMQVRRHSLEEIFEIYETREILETAAIRAAAQRRTEADLARIRELLAKMSDPSLDVADRIDVNREFHAAIWMASHNSVLSSMLDRLYESSMQYLASTLIRSDRWAKSMEEHNGMVEAIAAGDAQTGAALVSKHLKAARDYRATQM